MRRRKVLPPARAADGAERTGEGLLVGHDLRQRNPVNGAGRHQQGGIDFYDNLQKNADGSTDLYVGPKPPAGQESNWLQAVSGKGFYLMLRAYGSTEAFFDKTWRLPDAQKVQ